jgi:glycosyltransferase involved in cell wall biosynthesis
MKLAILGHHVAPICPPFAGGVESFTWYLCRWLAAQGHEVVLYAPPGSAVPGVEVRELALELPLTDAARADVSMPPDVFMRAHHAYQCALLELGENADGFDLVHSHSLHYLPVAMAGTLPMPLLLTLHTPPTPWLEAALRAHARGSLEFSVVSRQTARSWAPVLDIPRIITNGVDLDAWPAGPGGDRVAWCGRMVPEKAPHLAIDAARRAGLPIALAGPVSDPTYFEAEVRPRLAEDARHVGHLDHVELAQLLGTSAVALMTPAWDEPFGLAAVEAMCTGTPVAAFARGGLASIVTTEAGRLARPGDVDDLARAIVSARGLSRDTVRATVHARFGIDTMGHAYEALYAELAADGDPRVALSA